MPGRCNLDYNKDMWIGDYGPFLPENIPYRDISQEDQVAQLKKQMAQQKRQQLFEEISEIIYDVLSVYPDTPNSKLEDDLYMDNIDLVELIIRLEQEYSVPIRDDETNWVNVEDIIKTIERKI